MTIRNLFEKAKAKSSEILFRLRQRRRTEAISRAVEQVKKGSPEKEVRGPLTKVKILDKPAKKEDPQKKQRERQEKKDKRKNTLKFHLDLAGIDKEPQQILKAVLITAVIIDVAGFIYMLIRAFTTADVGFLYVFFLFLAFMTLGYAVSLFIAWIIFYVYIDVRVYQRKVEIEHVLPDFLQLASANMKSGMPIDRAMWLAVRPKFGVLAKEIETVAKQTMTGSDLENALKGFADKYDSMTLKRAISLIIEGLRSGGEIGDLLNRISADIQDSYILKKEMSASLTTYVIFITFATILAAPFLFGLASQLLSIVQEVTSSIDMPTDGTGSIGISVSGSGIAQDDFQIFAMAMLSVTSLFSAMIIATIQKGDVKAGLRYIPIFIITSLILFKLASWMLGLVFEGMF